MDLTGPNKTFHWSISLIDPPLQKVVFLHGDGVFNSTEANATSSSEQRCSLNCNRGIVSVIGTTNLGNRQKCESKFPCKCQQ